MWECVKCGHKSGKRTTNSYGCEHEWWDEDELATARAERVAEQKRELFAFNDELLNTERGQKLLSGKEGWNWMESEKAKLWLDSSFGTDWLSSKSGKIYVNYLREIILTKYKNKEAEKIGDFIEHLETGFLEENYLEDAKIRSLVNEMRTLLKEELNSYIAIGGDYWNTKQGKQFIIDLINELWVLLLSGKKGWDWLSNLTENRSKKMKLWMDSPFGINWLSSEKGKVYLNYLRENTLIISKKEETESEIINITIKGLENNAFFVIGSNYLKTEQGKQFTTDLINELWALLLSGEKGWDWYEADEDKGKKVKLWLDSSFGANWLSSEKGKEFLNYIRESILESEDIDLVIENIEEHSVLADIIGSPYLKTEQGKQFSADLVNELNELKKRNKKETIHGCAIIFIVYIIYISSVLYFRGTISVIMLLLSGIVFLITLFKKEWLFAFLIAVMFIILPIVVMKMLVKYGIIAG